MKRFVTYIYQYDQGIRRKNVGFIKTDIRDSGCQIEINIRGLEGFQGHAKIFFIVSVSDPVGLAVGDLPIGQGSGRVKLGYPRCLIGETGYSVSQIHAVVIRYGGGRLLISSWADDLPTEILRGQFQTPTPAIAPNSTEQTDVSPDAAQPPFDNESQLQEAVPQNSTDRQDKDIPIVIPSPDTSSEGHDPDVSAVIPDSGVPTTSSSPDTSSKVHTSNTATAISHPDLPLDLPAVDTQTAPDYPASDTPSAASSPDLPSQFPDSDVHAVAHGSDVHPETTSVPQVIGAEPVSLESKSDDAQVTYQKIEITDIRRLPKRNWYLCNNSFLIHGFFNYHYLILKTIEKKDQKKCYLGVPGIYEQPERMMALIFGFPEFEPAKSESTSQTGVFGYWMCLLDCD